MPRNRIPKLPQLLDRKIYKSGQTRGADDDEIYQNRVGRTSTVLIPYHFWNDAIKQQIANGYYESGYIVLIKPAEYFSLNEPEATLIENGLKLGENALVFYETRQQWNAHNPEVIGWLPATSRQSPLGGQYIARVPATTAIADGGKINRGFTATAMKGAGIRLYEYANSETVKNCRVQLEAEYWLCYNSIESAVSFGMNHEDAEQRKATILQEATTKGLLNYEQMRESRILNAQNETICPLCLERLSGYGFYSRLVQAEGREVPDLTVTEINLFHIKELRYGEFNHRPYNLGWGHHHCNVVVKDSGILPTLQWMKKVIERNEDFGVNIGE